MPGLYLLPPVIQCVELASQRAAATVRGRIKRGLTTLASVAATASFIGFFGTVLGLLNSFPTLGTSQSAGLAITSQRISEAMIPALLGLFVAVTAFWFHQYLSGQLAALDREMESETVNLVNRLVVHLAELRTTDPVRWAAVSRKPGNAKLSCASWIVSCALQCSSFGDSFGIIEPQQSGGRFAFARQWIDHPSAYAEMILPLVPPWMEKPYRFSRFGVYGRHIGAFVAIAKYTTICQIDGG